MDQLRSQSVRPSPLSWRNQASDEHLVHLSQTSTEKTFSEVRSLDFEGIVGATAPDEEAFEVQYDHAAEGFLIAPLAEEPTTGQPLLWIVEPRFHPAYDWKSGAVLVAPAPRFGAGGLTLSIEPPAGTTTLQFSVGLLPPVPEQMPTETTSSFPPFYGAVTLLYTTADGGQKHGMRVDHFPNLTPVLIAPEEPIGAVVISVRHPGISEGVNVQLVVDNVFAGR